MLQQHEKYKVSYAKESVEYQQIQKDVFIHFLNILYWCMARSTHNIIRSLNRWKDIVNNLDKI